MSDILDQQKDKGTILSLNDLVQKLKDVAVNSTADKQQEVIETIKRMNSLFNELAVFQDKKHLQKVFDSLLEDIEVHA